MWSNVELWNSKKMLVSAVLYCVPIRYQVILFIYNIIICYYIRRTPEIWFINNHQNYHKIKKCHSSTFPYKVKAFSLFCMYKPNKASNYKSIFETIDKI